MCIQASGIFYILTLFSDILAIIKPIQGGGGDQNLRIKRRLMNMELMLQDYRIQETSIHRYHIGYLDRLDMSLMQISAILIIV